MYGLFFAKHCFHVHVVMTINLEMFPVLFFYFFNWYRVKRAVIIRREILMVYDLKVIMQLSVILKPGRPGEGVEAALNEQAQSGLLCLRET